MITKCYSYSQIGEYHKKTYQLCQDKVFIITNDDYTGIALADGAGSLKYCGKGAEIAAIAACEYIQKNFDELYAESNNIKVSFMIINHVLYKLKQHAAETETNVSEYGSTLLVFAVKNDRYLQFHLGDGAILKIDKYTGIHKILSSPRTGIIKQFTHLTTSDEAWKHAKYAKGNISGKNEIILLCSDGFYSFHTLNTSFMKIMKRKNYYDMLKDSLQQHQNELQDDSSFVICDITIET